MTRVREYLNYIYGESEIIWDEGLVRQNGPGHTAEVSKLEAVHPGRTTTLVYAAGRFTGNIDCKEGVLILREVQKLQVTEPNDRLYGCFRWYREETKPNDTNAAFFTLEPLVVIRLLHPGILDESEKDIIDRMLHVSAGWFTRECSNPILYYTNKIISDGAMLAAIGRITNDMAAYGLAIDFFGKWLDYTENRGYGWGENLSLGYNSVILRAFNIIMKALDTESDARMIERFRIQEKNILDIFRFYNGHEFVPTIRSYNIKGNPRPWSLVYNLAGVRGFGFLDGNQETFGSGIGDAVFRLTADYMIYGSRLYLDEDDYVSKNMENPLKVPRSGVFSIMDERKAYAWLGKNGGIGSIDEFPVIDGSYQYKRWGLGWQSFPVSVIVYDNQVSFLRFYVDDGTLIRCHPHKDKHTAFLDPALFKESFYPEVRTSCRQSGQTLVVFRNLNGLRNYAEHISDSFDVQNFVGRWVRYSVNDRIWLALLFDRACLLVSTLLGNPAAVDKPVRDERNNVIPTAVMSLEIIEEGNDIRLVQNIYKGAGRVLTDDRLSAGWLFHYIDEPLSEAEVFDYIRRIKVNERCEPDGEIPRMPEWNVHHVDINIDNESLIAVRYDPYKK